MASGSPVSTPILFICWAQEKTSSGESAPLKWLNLAACTFIGHDRDEHACECADGLRPWAHCPAHRNRAWNFMRMGLPTGGPYWEAT